MSQYDGIMQPQHPLWDEFCQELENNMECRGFYHSAEGAEHVLREARVCSDVDRDARLADAARELGFVLRTRRGVQAQLAKLLRALVRGGTLEYGGKVVRYCDHS